MDQQIKTFEDACNNDVTVRTAIKLKIPHEQLIAMLAEDKRRLIQQLVILESIAPRKMEVNGKTYVWHCPDHLVPSIPFEK